MEPGWPWGDLIVPTNYDPWGQETSSTVFTRDMYTHFNQALRLASYKTMSDSKKQVKPAVAAVVGTAKPAKPAAKSEEVFFPNAFYRVYLHHSPPGQ